MNLRENFAPLTINLAGVVIVGIVLVLMQWASPVLAPIFFAWYLTALAFPFFSAFKQRGMNRGISLLLLVGGMLLVGLLIGGLMFLGTIRLGQGLETYGGLLDGRQAELESALESINLENSVDSEQLKGLLASLAVMAATVAGNFLFAVALSAFILLESDRFSKILQSATSAHPIMQQMPALMKTAIAYFGIRTRLNLITGVGFTLLLLLLGVDYALLWGILAFFLSYIPYIGLLTAMIPPSLLAYAEFGIGRALIIIAGAVVLNLTIENILEPSYTGRRLSLSPSVVFVSFFFWAWLLGPVGAILSMPITVMLLLVLSSDEHTQWLARIISKTGELPQELEAKGSSEKASPTG
jgi:predicted PurR-regulated permease PerM